MQTIVRSTRPTCPACGFAVFNRRCAKCEKCQAELPASIAYTPAEIAKLRQAEGVEEEARVRRMSKARAERARRGAGTTFIDGGTDGGSGPASVIDAIDLAVDLVDLLKHGGS